MTREEKITVARKMDNEKLVEQIPFMVKYHEMTGSAEDAETVEIIKDEILRRLNECCENSRSR